MKIRLVHIVHDTTISYSHALASIGSVLAQDFRPIEIDLSVVRSNDVRRNAEQLLKGDPDFLFFTCMSNQWRHACQIAQELRAINGECLLAVGGSHIIADTASAHKSLFDIAVNGEGEYILDQIIGAKPQERANKSCQIINGQIVSDLDALPLPLLDIFEVNDILAYPSVMFSRGCPYRCNYCMSRLGGVGGKIRWKTPHRAVREVEQVIEYAKPAEIYIDDDTFLKNPNWVKEFCEIYSSSINTPFLCNARPETVRPELCEVLVSAGCLAIGIGIESGSERIRHEVLGRRMTDEKIIRAFDAVHEAGMKTWSFNMVGIPEETVDDLRKTIALNERVATDYVRVSVYTPYPGTPLYKDMDTPYVGGYIRASSVLSGEKARVYESWLDRLDSEGRLWFTKSEAQLLQ